MHKATLILFLALALSLLAEADTNLRTPQAGYSTTTLRDPIFDAARVAVETAAFNNWLNGNYGSLTDDQLPSVREHLYYLIDSHIKHRFLATGQVLPDNHDLILEILYSWSEPLGVYGGNLVLNAVKGPESKARDPLKALPEGIALTLGGDLLRVESHLGWEVLIPYYFMIGELADFVAGGGLRTQLMIVSTGAAKDNGQIGRSQATLMLMFSPNANLSEFQASWEGHFEVDIDEERVELGIRGLTSQRAFAPALQLHREIVFWEEPHGSFAVAYLGNDGTYQWNRDHFLDFLRSLDTELSTSSNNALERARDREPMNSKRLERVAQRERYAEG